MDRLIRIERATTSVNAVGTPVETWSTLAELRAEIVEQSTQELIRAAGAVDETARVFRTWWLDGITTADRIVEGGRIFNIKQVSEMGRRQRLELRAVERAP